MVYKVDKYKVHNRISLLKITENRYKQINGRLIRIFFGGGGGGAGIGIMD